MNWFSQYWTLIALAGAALVMFPRYRQLAMRLCPSRVRATRPTQRTPAE